VLYTPIFDYRDPVSIGGAGALFFSLPTLPVQVDFLNARWFWRLNPSLLALGPSYLEMYVPSTGLAVPAVPPTSLNRVTTFATGLLYTGGNTTTTWGGTPINAINIYGAAIAADQSPQTITPTSVYLPATPVRYAGDLIGAYIAIATAINSSFISPEEQALGLISCFNPVVANSVFVNANSSIQLSGVATLGQQLVFMVSEVGSIMPLDCGSIGRSAVFAFKRTPSVQMMPFAMNVASATSPTAALMIASMRIQAYNTWNTELAARMARGKGIYKVASSPRHV
jgi:hypothetical protein